MINYIILFYIMVACDAICRIDHRKKVAEIPKKVGSD